MRIRLTAGETVLNATLDDNATARDFASLLPLTLR
ncbi:cyclophilin-like fold protein [Streptomyces sp. NBC_00024]